MAPAPGGVIPALAVGGAVLLGPVGGVVGGLVGAVLSFFGTRALYLLVARAREKHLKRVFDALVREVNDLARPAKIEESALDDARERVGLAPAPEARALPESREQGVTVPALDEQGVKR